MGQPWSIARVAKSLLNDGSAALLPNACGGDLPGGLHNAGSAYQALGAVERYLLDVFFSHSPSPPPARRLACLGSLAGVAIALRQQPRPSPPTSVEGPTIWAGINLLFDYDSLLLDADTGGFQEAGKMVRCALTALSVAPPGAAWNVPSVTGSSPELVPVPVVLANRILAQSPSTPPQLVKEWRACKTRLLLEGVAPKLQVVEGSPSRIHLPRYYPYGLQRIPFTNGEGSMLLARLQPIEDDGIGAYQTTLEDVVECGLEAVHAVEEMGARPEPIEVVVRLSQGRISVAGVNEWLIRTKVHRTHPELGRNKFAQALWNTAKGDPGLLTAGNVRALNSCFNLLGLGQVRFRVDDPHAKGDQRISLEPVLGHQVRFVARGG